MIEQSDIEEATYSAEDNKIRLYPRCRLDDDVYQRVKAAGFRWAPRQELFVAPSWSPSREDLAMELAGEIVAEGSTMVERAEAKAARLDNLSAKRASESGAYAAAADRISQRFAMGQPILVGHHSERKARSDQKKMHSAMDRSVESIKAANYWAYKAEGVERNANRKGRSDVRARRIKKLLKDLRDRQRVINHGYILLDLWNKVDQIEDQDERKEKTRFYSGAHFTTGCAAPYNTWSQLDKGEITTDQVIEKCLTMAESTIGSSYTARWISHLLNRLAFERSELGETARYEGEITPVILQTFARENGAHKPKAKREAVGITLASDIPLPVHLGDGKELTLSSAEWRDLMQSCGYEVPAPKAKAAPILNFKAGSIKIYSPNIWGNAEEKVYHQIEMTKAEYSALHESHRGVRHAKCQTFRIKFCQDPAYDGPGYMAPWVAVFMTDSKIHPAPESDSIINEKQVA